MRPRIARHTRVTLLVLGFALSAFAAGAQVVFQKSISLGSNGTLDYQEDLSSASCITAYGHGHATYSVARYNTFVYVNSQGTKTTVPGSIETITGSPGPIKGSNCPPNLVTQTFAFIGSNYEIYVYSTSSGGINAAFAIGVQGYINPKYVVVGVIYSPPGSKSNVVYTNSTLVSNTSSVTSTFTKSTTNSISVTSPGGIFGFLGGSETQTESTTVTQSTQNSSSVTATLTTTQGLTQPGPTSDYVGINHDFDLIKVWINPIMRFTLYDFSITGPIEVTWNGYGFSELDPTAPIDIQDVPVGCLNGDSAATQPACAGPLAAFKRGFAANENWPAGEGPGLTQADLDNILAADPWGHCSPASPVGASVCPTYATPGFVLLPPQFTISDQTDIPYRQPLPGDQPGSNSYGVITTTSTTQGQQTTNTYSQTYGVEDSFIGSSFLMGFSAKVSNSQTLTWSYQQNQSVTKTNTSTGTANITQPACVGNPCNPRYPPATLTYGTATEFDIFQDNFFGTFVFVPASYN